MLVLQTMLQQLIVVVGLLLHAVEHGRLLLLPDEDVVDHGAATKQNADTDQYARDDGRCRVELGECVKNDTWMRR